MTREQLLHAVGDIRDTFIREAAPPPASYRKRREFPWAGAVAACLALVIVGSTFFLSQLGKEILLAVEVGEIHYVKIH